MLTGFLSIERPPSQRSFNCQRSGNFVIDLRHRNRQPELMDDPAVDPQAHELALRGLARINAISGAARSLWRTIRRIAHERSLAPIRVLDIACGRGDLAWALKRHADRRRLPIHIEGIDLSPTAVDFANERYRDQGLKFHVADALEDELPSGFDVITCNLFLHHLDAEQAVHYLRRTAAAARHAVIVDDLCRSWCGYALAWAGCRLLSRSPIVHYDGPLSVEGAFTIAEAAALASRAGLQDAQLRRHWPERYQLVWRRPD